MDNNKSRKSFWFVVIGVGAVWVGLNVVIYGVVTSSSSAHRGGYGIPRKIRECYEAHTFRRSIWARDELSLPYRLMKPRSQQPRTQYPLLVFLHGAGSRGHDNQRQLGSLPAQLADPQWREQFSCFLVAPQCPDELSWGDTMHLLEGLLDELLESYPVDRRRVYLTGLSMGGFGSWELAARRPELFAAVVPICGGGDSSSAGRLVGVPIWAVHGDADKVVPVESSRRMVEAVRHAGGNPRYTELNGVGHESWAPAYRDPEGVLHWMFQQVNRRADAETNK